MSINIQKTLILLYDCNLFDFYFIKSILIYLKKKCKNTNLFQNNTFYNSNTYK